ncbi:AbrB family transcriptional regulator [Candidatus Marsarchaeota G2 archaeon ECH_B_SAG-G16]|uniref:AbrB family transcriptional regulator n=1 Tax=Candidatus Marsarchaeota G2 archaeon ECH_B_SAG-G16 TaxID=1978167 RepID=A0A2R6C3I3_9ARCH|nr:MAG: AbrB family transcriptional regulator [Candidatus Marsarchaeota G2 archaeon ECH_B_SAG-G16]
MPKTTKKFQVTIPKHVREKINLKPGEELEVFALNDNEILLKRKIKKVKNPLEILIGKQQTKEISPDKLDELVEN